MNDQEYREGDEEQKVDDSKQEGPVPITAFALSMMPDGKIVIMFEVPGVECQHRVSLAEVRNICMAAAEDAKATLLSKMAAITMTEALMQATVKAKRRSQIVIPGHGPGKRGRG